MCESHFLINELEEPGFRASLLYVHVARGVSTPLILSMHEYTMINILASVAEVELIKHTRSNVLQCNYVFC